MPVWLGVGGRHSLPVLERRPSLMVAIIGGEFRVPTIDRYLSTGRTTNGASPERLKVGVHAIGFVGTTNETRTPSSRLAVYVHRNRPRRGWAPTTRAQFEAMCGPRGLIGSAIRDRAAKMLSASEALGGVSASPSRWFGVTGA